ncbi:MAG: hypothetical protein GXO29_07150 [Thermotogae bacterium]|nr:hypothetical protein [Thermotogota bacterium]
MGVPVKFKVISFSPSHLLIEDLQVGGGIYVRRLFASFYLDALLLQRRLEVAKLSGVRIDVPSILEDFSERGERGEGGGRRGPTSYPPFKVRKVLFYDATLYPTESLRIDVLAGRFSFAMGGNTLRITDGEIQELRTDIDSSFEVDRAFGDAIMRRDTLYVRLKATGKYAKYSLTLNDGRMSLWQEGDTVLMEYRIREFSAGDDTLSLKVSGLKALWRLKDTPGRIDFSADRLTIQDTLVVLRPTGGAILDSLPERLRLEGLSGGIYGGIFRANIIVESLQVFRGDAYLRGMKPMGLFDLSADAYFRVSLKDSSVIVAGDIGRLRIPEPSLEINDMNFSLESRDLRRYDFNLLGEFTEVFGAYDVSADRGYLEFNVDRPVSGISYGDLRLYTFSARGRVVKVKDELSAEIPSLKVWFLVYDTLRIDSLILRNTIAKVNLKDLRSSEVSGDVVAFHSQVDTAVLRATYMYRPDRFEVAGDVMGRKYGSLTVSLGGRIPDSISVDSIRYVKEALDATLKGITLLNRDTIALLIPKNPLLGGEISGEVKLVRDSAGYRFVDSSAISLRGIDPSPVFGAFLEDWDVLVDGADLTALFRGTVEEPEITGQVYLKNPSYGDMGLDSVRALYRVGKDVVGLSDAFLWADGVPVEVSVGNYYMANSTLYVLARTENFPTDRFLPFLLPDSSAVSFELSVSGKVDSPKVLGYLYWRAKGIDINGNLVRRPSLYAVAYGDRIVLPSMGDTNVARFRRGKVSFWGEVGTDLLLDSLIVELRGAEIQLDPDINSILSGRIEVRGDLRRELMATGDVLVEEMEFFKPLTEMASGGGATSSVGKPVILYDIHVYAPRRIFLNSTLTSQALSGILLEIDAELSADLNLQKSSPTLSTVSGNLTFLQGRVYIVDKVFNIDRGEINLYGTSGTVSILSSATFPRITPQGESDSIKVFVSIEGELEKPTVRIWSQPYMATGDILALIVGGSNVLGFLSRGLRWGLNVTELSIQQTPTSYQLLFGTYITPRIYLKSVLSTTGDYNSIRTLYFVTPRFSIYGERIQDPKGTRYGVGINLRLRF